MTKKLLLLIVPTLIVQTLFSQKQTSRPDDKLISNTAIDSVTQKLMDAAGVTGLSLGIVNDNKISYVKSYGYKNKATNQLSDTATTYYAASFSKSVFAYLVMQLVDKGIINLDKPLYKYLPKPLPEYENYKDLAGDERWKLITARYCLSHTTGFPNWRQLNPNDNQKLEIFFAPGKRFAYSGEGIYLLQLVIETITKRKLEDLAQENIFKPAGMTRSSFLWQKSFEANYAVGHDKNEDTLSKIKRTEANAAGSMETTITDYTRFVASVMQGKGLSSKSKQQMLSPQISIFTKQQFPSLNNDTTSKNKNIQLSYGLGWGLFKSVYGWAFFKEGHSDDGWQHYTVSFPDKKYAIVIMTNSLNGESIFKELIEQISGVTIPWEWEGYTPYKPTIKVSEKILEQYIGDYDGRTKATISLVNGQLKVESQTEGLAKTNLYPENENHFFMKSMPISIEFVKSINGGFKKIIVNDEGEIYELNKVNNIVSTQTTKDTSNTDIKSSKNALSTYIGKYVLKDNSKKTLVIELQEDYLIAKISGQESLELIFTSDTKFKFKSVIEIKGEFINENGKITKLIVEQNGKYEWRKIE
ncbi:MAG: serine hydrolase domain-containing protein [Ferruginibacter sp.]